jgi:hypothetical protein
MKPRTVELGWPPLSGRIWRVPLPEHEIPTHCDQTLTRLPVPEVVGVNSLAICKSLPGPQFPTGCSFTLLVRAVSGLCSGRTARVSQELS